MGAHTHGYNVVGKALGVLDPHGDVAHLPDSRNAIYARLDRKARIALLSACVHFHQAVRSR